jgi:hypothetical protein
MLGAVIDAHEGPVFVRSPEGSPTPLAPGHFTVSVAPRSPLNGCDYSLRTNPFFVG